MKDLLILVDKNDNELGAMDKLSTHQKGELHRAFSIFIFNQKGEILLQQRADEKYHSGGLWSNSCCSHPRIGEETVDAANRRLMEEMGMRCTMEFKFSFIYKSEYENGLIEHEFDHVFFGRSDQLPNLNTKEVKDWKYMSIEKLEKDLLLKPHLYTSWLNISLPRIIEHINKTRY